MPSPDARAGYAFHLGAARRLQQAGITAHVTTGASSGSLVAAATGLSLLDPIYDSWREVLGVRRLIQPRRVLRGHWPVTMSHILRSVLKQWFGETYMADVPIPLGITVTTLGLRGRQTRLLHNGHVLRVTDAIAASSFIPGIYSRMVPIQRRLTFDGAWERRTPILEAVELGATQVIAFVANPHGALLAGTRGKRVLPIPSNVRVLHPTHKLPVQGFDFDQERIKATFALGNTAGENFLRTHEAWLGNVY